MNTWLANESKSASKQTEQAKESKNDIINIYILQEYICFIYNIIQIYNIKKNLTKYSVEPTNATIIEQIISVILIII